MNGRGRKIALFCLCIAFVGLRGAASPATPVRVWEESIAIPTYDLGPASSLPTFPNSQDRPFFPYPVLDDFRDTRSEKMWRALFLENDYLKVTVLPDLGGKLYSIYDKTYKREVLYTNHVVKYADIGIRGAWTSGGIEWNFPDGHTVTAVTPVDYTTRQEHDGSAEIVVGDTERVQDMQWTVMIRLHPGVRAVETETALRNPNAIPGRYWYWANAAVAAREDLRFVYPMLQAQDHATKRIQTFPVYNKVDYSLWRAIPIGTSLFAMDSQRDFFGAYYEKSNWGLVHVADHRLLPGKKIWSWGQGKDADRDVQSLTDSDGPYAEIQAGRGLNQSTHMFIPPRFTERFLETWYPVDLLGGPWDEANRNGVLRVVVDKGQVRIWLESNRTVEGAEVLLGDASGAVLQNWKTPLAPGLPFSATAETSGKGPFRVSVRGADGSELIHYRTDQSIDGHDVSALPKPQPPPDSGKEADAESKVDVARAAWLKATEGNTNPAPRVALGVSFYRTAQYPEALKYLRDALGFAGTTPAVGEIDYYLGLALQATGKNDQAKAMFTNASAYADWAAPARVALGEIALADGAIPTAIDALLKSGEAGGAYLAVAYRMSGTPVNSAKAKALLEQLRRDQPLDYLALNEASLNGDTEAGDLLWRLLDREPDHVVNLALAYARVKNPEARVVLEKAIGRAQGNPHPMWYYTLGWILETTGDTASAIAMYEKGAGANPRDIFPHRREEIEILNRALLALPARTPEYGRTAYYLGVALTGNLRSMEALEKWSVAGTLDPPNAVLHYLLGRTLERNGDLNAALAKYDMAVKADPNEYRLLLIRDDVLAKNPSWETRRLAGLENAPETVRKNWRVAARLIPLYVTARRLAELADLMEKTSFPVSVQSASWYPRAWNTLADYYARSGRVDNAVNAIVRSMLPPGESPNSAADELMPKACMEIASMLERTGKRDAAIEWITRAADWPKNSKASTPPKPTLEDSFNQGMAQARLRRFAEAKRSMESVLETDPIGEWGHQAEEQLRHWKAAGVIQ